MLFYACSEIIGDEHKAAGALLFSLLEKHVPSLARAELSRDANGAPYLTLDGERVRGICVSLSHSHNMCAAAVSDTPVGVDIELVRDKKNESKIASRFFSNITFPESIDEEKYPFFYKWTYCEACFKATQPLDKPTPVRAHKMLTLANNESYVLCVVKK